MWPRCGVRGGGCGWHDLGDGGDRGTGASADCQGAGAGRGAGSDDRAAAGRAAVAQGGPAVAAVRRN
ncbi:MAG: hypothetical protein C0409_12760 [Novosphingobium sp.]|nr:hypothetical protein [Novosphingobium sp.]